MQLSPRTSLHRLVFAFCVLSLQLLWNYSQSKAATTKDMLVATCTSLQHSSTKHYLSTQTPPEIGQTSCSLGRTLHFKQLVNVLHGDTAGCGAEAGTTELSQGSWYFPPVAPRYQQDPCTGNTNAPCIAHSNRDQPRAGGSKTAQPLLKQAASGLAVPVLCPRQAGVRAAMAQGPGGKGLSAKQPPSVQLQGAVRANKPQSRSCRV